MTLGRILYDVTQLLESRNGANQRVRRVLELLRGLVPYERCAVLELRLGDEPRFVTVPESQPDEREALSGTLVDILGHLVDAKTRVGARAERPAGVHLAVPLIGLDQVIGLLFVRSSVGEYTEEHVRALSVVAAKLAAYFTMLRAGVELIELTRQRDEARCAAVTANRQRDELQARLDDHLRNAADGGSAQPPSNVPSKLGTTEPGLPPADRPTDERRLSGLRVLLVDHDSDICESFKLVLDDHGAHVTTAVSSPEALTAFERSRPDVLLIGDLAIHGGSANDLIREVTARTSPLPIVSISAWRLEETDRAPLAAIRLHLVKPLEIRALVETVAQVAGRAVTAARSRAERP